MKDGYNKSAPSTERYVMVLEDNDLIGDQFIRWLKRKFPDQHAKRAKSIAEAHELLNQLNFDFFLLDIVLPDGNGIDFLCDVKMINPAARVIVMTATPLPEFRDKARSLGTIRFMEKPVDMSLLEQELKKHLAAKANTKDSEDRQATDGQGNNPTAKGFRAILEGITLLDLIQLKCLGRYSTQLEFSCEDGISGRIHIDQGQIVHAEAPGNEGIEALHQILTWHRGSVHEKRNAPQPSNRTIQGDWQVLLMEAAQAIDESGMSP